MFYGHNKARTQLLYAHDDLRYKHETLLKLLMTQNSTCPRENTTHHTNYPYNMETIRINTIHNKHELPSHPPSDQSYNESNSLHHEKLQNTTPTIRSIIDPSIILSTYHIISLQECHQ